jgi:ATP-binding cassette subfamily C (CFTR/MRP) protein 10
VLQLQDMPALPGCLDVQAATSRFEAQLKLSAHGLNSDGCFEIYRCLYAAHAGGRYLLLASVKFFVDCLGVASPYLLKRFLDWLQYSDGNVVAGCFYLGLMAGIAFATAIITPHYSYQLSCVALNVRSSIMMSVFQRCALHRPQQLDSISSDESSATNLISIDSQRVADTVSSFNELWSLPVQVALSFYLLYCEVGWSFLAGVLFMLLVVPINMLLARTIQRSTALLSTHRDCRIERMRRMLKGIRTIKSYSLEGHCVESIRTPRSLEFAQLRRRKLADSGCVLFWAITPVSVVLATFAAYCWMNSGSELTTGQLFSSITLLNMLVYPFNAFPWVINGIMEARISAKRLQRYIAHTPDLVCYSRSITDVSLVSPRSALQCQISSDLPHVSCISMSDFVVAACPTLQRVSERVFKIGPMNLVIRSPQILAIVGPVSSGKSALVRALVGECAIASGSFTIDARVSYSSQEPFLFDGSVLDNIIFGSELNAKILSDVTASSGLDRDAKSWVGGLSYIVGPGGRRCSSGQRMRISVARAFYRCQVSSTTCIPVLDGPTTGLDEALVHLVLDYIIKLAHQGSIICVSFASQQHLELLLDKCPKSVTVISLQQNCPPRIFAGSEFLISGSAVTPPHSSDIVNEQLDGHQENQQSPNVEMINFGGLIYLVV